jgi:multidrug efflux pump subunit AcrA (membrane-fusion protein)
MRMKRWVILTITAVVAVMGYWSTRTQVPDTAPAKVLRQVAVETVKYNNYAPQIKLIAQAENPQFSNLQSVSSGQVVSVHAKEGLKVKKNEPLVCLDDTQALLDLKMIKKECRVLESQSLSVGQEMVRLNARQQHQKNVLDQAKIRFERITRLKKKGHVSDQEFEQEKSNWSARQSEHEALMSQLDQVQLRKEQMVDQLLICESKQKRAQKNLEDHCLKAPFDGKVVEVFASKGMMVSPSVPLVQFIGNENDRLYAMVLSSQLALLDRGVQNAVPVISSLGTIEYQGVVESQNGTFQLKFIGVGSFVHGKAYEILLELNPVQSSILVEDSMIYDERYVFSLSPLEQGVYRLVQEPVACSGYHWKEGQRLHVCTFNNDKKPEMLLKTRVLGALDGMKVRVQ